MEDWKIRLQQKLNKPVIELTGDITPDVQAIKKSKVIVTTPEKWDAVSRSWQTRSFVQAVRLIVIDEIHLLGKLFVYIYKKLITFHQLFVYLLSTDISCLFTRFSCF